MIIELGEGIALAVITGAISGATAFAAQRVELKYMKRDIRDARRSGDRANFRLDSMGVKPGGERFYERAGEGTETF